jgi:acetyl-CoA carboxylase biotin carboxyl carrier protein
VARIAVKSEITGTVWKVTSTVGGTLAAEDTIVILEAMKMEIPVAAPKAGTLQELMVKEGDPVTEGQTVAILEG